MSVYHSWSTTVLCCSVQDTSGLEVQLTSATSGIPKSISPEAKSVLRMFSKNASLPADAFDTSMSDVLEDLVRRDVVEGPPWALTAVGKKSLQFRVRLSEPKPLLIAAARDSITDETTLAELILALEKQGWTDVAHLSSSARKTLKLTPYDPSKSSSEKRWYTKGCPNSTCAASWFRHSQSRTLAPTMSIELLWVCQAKQPLRKGVPTE